jgi:hypothetical protein
MAIDKIGRRSTVVWNRTSLTYIVIAAVLALVALIFLWLAVKNYMVRSNYIDAAFKQDSNRRSDVRAAADKARSWGRHAESLELYGKALVDANQFEAAEKVYAEISASLRSAIGHCGMGILLLRKADGEKDDKKAADLAKKAKDQFTQAKAADSALIEAQIGSATADLIAGIRLKDDGKIASARSEFLKVHKQVTGSEAVAATVSREGYIDLYVGLARSHASLSKYNPEALGFAGAARRYLPGSNKLYAMELALQAQKMTERPDTPADIRGLKTYERLKKLKDTLANTKNQKEIEEVTEAWQAMVMATGAALAQAGDKDSEDMLNLASGLKSVSPLMAEVLEASLAMTTAVTPVENAGQRAANSNKALNQIRKVLAMKEMQEPGRALLRSALLNNQAVLEAEDAATTGNDEKYQISVQTLLKALEAEKEAGLPDGSYEVRRNLAVIQKRRGQADAAEHYSAAQRAASARGDAVKEDLEKLTKYLAGSP